MKIRGRIARHAVWVALDFCRPRSVDGNIEWRREVRRLTRSLGWGFIDRGIRLGRLGRQGQPDQDKAKYRDFLCHACAAAGVRANDTRVDNDPNDSSDYCLRGNG